MKTNNKPTALASNCEQLTQFESRPIGVDSVSCLVCGGERETRTNFSAFTLASERMKVINLLEQAGGHAVLHRSSEVQVLVGACRRHKNQLKWLQFFTSDGFISSERVQQALKSKGRAPAGVHCTVFG